MSMTKTMVVVVATLLLYAGSAHAQAYLAAVQAAEAGAQKINDELIELKKANWEADKAEHVREALVGTDGKGGVSADFRTAVKQVDEQIAKLNTNAKENASELKQLKAAKANLTTASAKMRTLQSYMMDDKKMKLALKNGTLESASSAVLAAMKKSADAIEKVNESVNSTTSTSTDDKPGTIEIQKLEMKSGKVRLFVMDKTGSEVEVFEGSKIGVMKYPVVVRVSVQDTEKVRLEGQWGTGNANWDVKTPLQHTYAYSGQSGGGRSEWTAREEYKATKSEHAELVKTISQRNSDASTAKATGDIIEIVPTKPIAQGIGIDVSAKSVKWERNSVLTGGSRKSDVVSKDNAATVHLVVSFFPAGT